MEKKCRAIVLTENNGGYNWNAIDLQRPQNMIIIIKHENSSDKLTLDSRNSKKGDFNIRDKLGLAFPA